MKILRFVRLTIAHWFYTWALREIHPLHPDLPSIVYRRRLIADELRILFN